MTSRWRVSVAAVVLVGGVAWLLAGALTGCGKKESQGSEPLLCYVGGTMRPAMEALAKRYEEQTGRKVQIDYAGSGELLIRIETARKGDLYVCHDPFLSMLMAKGLGTEGWTVAVVTPAILVRKGNPKHIESLKDLARPGIKLGLTDPNYSTMGHILPTVFQKAGLTKQIEANVKKRTRGGSAIANDVVIGNLDAAIAWNAVAYLRRDKADSVPISPQYLPTPAVDAITSATGKTYDIGRIKVTLATLACSKQPKAAKEFAEFVSANRDVFVKDFGFSPAPPEAAQKSLLVYCGAGLRHAMADAAETFETQTGAKVQMDYAGSGVLISRVKLARVGDLYMPGDVWYLDQIGKEGLLVTKKMVTYFVPVIVVAKGNPKNIRTLADLAGPGVKVAVGNPKACQVGRLTEEVFAKNRIDRAAVEKNTVFSSVTVNELGVQVKMKAADAAIVWDAVAANFADSVDVVTIPTKENIISHVAIGVLKFSQNKPLAERFVDFLAGPEGRAIFVKHHYTVEEPR